MVGGEAVRQRYHLEAISMGRNSKFKTNHSIGFQRSGIKLCWQIAQAVCLQTTSCKHSPDPKNAARKWHQSDHAQLANRAASGVAPMPEPMHRRIIERALLLSVAVPFPRCGLPLRSRSLCENARERAARGARETRTS